MDELDKKLNEAFAGRVVRKDMTKLLKDANNVPIYVLEYLLGMYCATDDEETIKEGLKKVKDILAENYIRPDESEKTKSKIRESGRYTVIDHVTVKLNEKQDVYQATFSNLGIKGVEVSSDYVKEFDKLLGGGIWCILQMEYFVDEDKKGSSPFIIQSLKPIQMPNMDVNEVFEARKQFTKDEWIDVLIRSTGMEPSRLKQEVKWHLLARLIPLVENNYNLCELGPRGTGKSHVYKEISPNSILVSGGQTTVPNLFYNMANRSIGLVGLWDVVAFDEVAGIQFKDKDGIQILKDYMASGSFARGKEEKSANASIVYVGNIKETLKKVSVFEDILDFELPELSTEEDNSFVEGMAKSEPNSEDNKKEIYLLRVECLNVREDCIRVIEIPEKFSLYHLHDAIQDAVGFDKDHLFEFYAGRTERNRKIIFSEAYEWEERHLDYLNIRLSEIWPLNRLNLYYLFDFGDDWLFKIKKGRKVKEPEKGVEYPRVIEQVGENPEQYPTWDEEE